MKRAGFLLALLSITSVSASAQEKPSDNGIAFFESKIRPVLIQKCYRCHSVEAQKKKRLKGGLLLDSRNGMLKGGDTGPAVVPKDAKKSLLLSAIQHQKNLEMPPSGKLPQRVIADFAKWIAMGAPDPRAPGEAVAQKKIDIEAGRKHWSFQPLSQPSVPKVNGNSWAKTPIDQFILEPLVEGGLQPNPRAAPRALIRRACYDLLGLPPEPKQVEDFVKAFQKDPQVAWSGLITELLESPHYGERWARHWLDLARYAESNGYAFDGDRPNAYHYRDFVIKAFNADMPYNQFVQWQIAGDILKPGDYMAQAATGFLVAGPFTTQQTMKERERSRYEQLDDMIATLGTSMLGLTLGCARCHDHKYDPVPQEDYYRLISSFAEVGFADVGIPNNPEAFQKAKADHQSKVDELAKDLQQYEKTSLPANLQKWLANRPKVFPVPSLSPWHTVGPFPAGNFNQAFRRAFPPEKKVDLKASYLNGKLKWSPQPAWKDGQVHNPFTGNNAANYLYRTIDSPVSQPLALSLGSDDAIKVWHNGKPVLARQVSRGAAADQEKVTIALQPGRNEILMKIVNGAGPSGFYFRAAKSGPPANVVAILKKPQKEWLDSEQVMVLKWYQSQDAIWLQKNRALQALKAKAPKPTQTKVYSVKRRGTTYNFGGDTYKVYHLGRGNASQKKGLASPGFLQVLMTTTDQEKQWLSSTSEPRAAMAQWLTDVNQGSGQLLARVIVNRLWQHHFGHGLVSTPSDFGARGDRPTHPQLLEWLASQLIQHNWKLKPIHRLIMTSAVYMQSTRVDPKAHRIDPANKLWHRRFPRRLEAEAIRDALLAVSGRLDRKLYGKGNLNEKNNRRSIYLTVKRSRLIPILQLFDAPDSMQGIGKRVTTTVAPQALAMMNSPFVRDIAKDLAKRARPDKSIAIEQAVDSIYRIALSRPATATEARRMAQYIKGKPSEEKALTDVAQIILCLNEMIYID